MGKTVAALGLIGVIVMAASCSSSGSRAGSPTTVPRLGPSTTIVSTPSEPAIGVNDASLRGVNWSDVQYPMDCGANGTADVRSVEYATPAPDVEVAVVEVSCQLVATTPPSALFVYEPAAGGPASLDSGTRQLHGRVAVLRIPLQRKPRDRLRRGILNHRRGPFHPRHLGNPEMGLAREQLPPCFVRSLARGTALPDLVLQRPRPAEAEIFTAHRRSAGGVRSPARSATEIDGKRRACRP